MRKHFLLSFATLLVALFAFGQFASAATVYKLNENFNSLTSGIPTGWDNSEGTTTNQGYRWNYNSGGHNGTACVRFDSYSNYPSGNTNMLKTPAVDLASGDWLLKFWYKNPTGGDFFVYLSTDGGTTYTQALTANLIGAADWTYQEINLNNYTLSNNVKIVFSATSNYGSGDANIYLDDVTIESYPECKSPDALAVSNLTTTGATLTWGMTTLGNTPTAFRYTLRRSDGTQIAHSDSLVANGVYNITGLTANTTYTAELEGNCQSSYSGFSDMATVTFTTLCNAQSAPYEQDFNALSGVPSCTFSNNASINASGRTGKCLEFETDASSSTYIVFPELTLNSNNVEATFFLKVNSTSGGNATYQVGICTDPSDPGSSFESLYSGTLSNTSWNEIRMNTALTSETVTSTTKIAVIFPMIDDLTYYLDDVSIHAIPTCVRPEQFSVSNVTATSATCSWTTTTAPNCRIYAYTPTDTTSFLVSSSPATLTGLTPNTDYTFQIRGVCGANDSSEINPYPVTVHTQCLIADSALFLEDFENIISANTPPECWNMGWITKSSGNSRTAPFTVTTSKYHSGARAMSLVDQPSGNNSYLSTQQLPIDSAGKYTLSVWVYRENLSNYQNEGLNFYVGPSRDSVSNATLLGFIPHNYSTAPAEPQSNTWYNYEFVINNTGNQYIIIEGVSQYGNTTYFDDVQVKLTPSCMKVKNIALGTPSPSDVDLTWTAGASETQWIVNYTLTQGTTTIETVTDTVNTPTINIDGLTQATMYSVSGTVTSFCGANDQAEPVNFSFSFVSGCNAVSTLPYTCGFESNEVTSITYPMPFCWNRYNDAAGSYNYYPYVNTNSSNAHNGTGVLYFQTSSWTDYGDNQAAVLPEINTTVNPMNTLRVTFYTKASDSYYTGDIFVGLMTNPADFTTFTAIDSFNVSTTDFTKHETRFNTYTGNATYIAIAHKVGTSSAQIYVDDVNVGVIPTCLDLDGAGVTVSDVLSTTAKITCTDQTATNWSYAYGISGTPASACTPVDTNAQVVDLAGLSPQTTYVVYARRNCGTEYGAWSDGVYFTTACGAVTMPYTDDFESAAVGALGGCYNVTGGSSYDSYNVVSGTTYNHTANGTKGLNNYYYGSVYSTDATYTVTLLAHLESGKNYEIAGYAKAGASTSWSDYDWYLSFVLGGSATSVNVLSTSHVTATDFTRYNTYFTVSNTGDYFIGFKTEANPDNYYYYPYFDDLTITEVGCIPPTGTLINGLTSDSVNISFTSPGATQWEVAVSASPIDIEGTVVGEVYNDTVNTAGFAIGGLSVNTLYYYTVRTICAAGGVSAWMQPQTFRTQCSAFSVPYSEGFEDVGSTLCWTAIGGTGTITRDASQHNTGAGSMQVASANAGSPEMNVTTLAPYMITGWAYATTANATFDVKLTTDLTDASAASDAVAVVTIPTANTWTEFTANFGTFLNDPDNADWYNARYVVLAAGQGTVNFDDILIDVVPTCPKPNQGTISGVAAHQAVIDWTETGTATSWSVRAVPNAGATITRTGITAHPYTLTGLNAASSYTIYVRSNCSATDSSYEYKVGVLTTDCDYVNAPYTETFEGMTSDAVPTCWDNSGSTTSTLSSNPQRVWGVYYAAGNKSIRMYNYYVSSGDALINTPEIILEAGKMYELRYDYCNQANCGDLLVKIKRHSDASFVTVGTHAANGSTDYTAPGAFITEHTGITSYAGDTIQIQFYSAANYGSGAIFVDNVKVRELSSCVEPVNIFANNLAATSADIMIDDTVATHNSWQYVYGVTGFDYSSATPIPVSNDTFSLTGLLPSTTYDVYVRAVCSANDFSTWNYVTFKTTATPPTFPYSCDFTNNAENAAWEKLQGAGTNEFMIGTDANAVFTTGGAALYVSNSGNYTYDTYSSNCVAGMSRVFSFSSGTYDFEFDWKCSGGDPDNDYARFYLVPVTSAALPSVQGSYYYSYSWPTTMIALDDNVGHCNVSGVQHCSKAIDMTGREGSYNLVFVWVNDDWSGVTTYPFSVSNITVSEVNCQLVTNAAVIGSMTTTSSITATCTNPNPGATTRWAISTSNMAADSIMSGIAATDTFTITGLSASSTYYLLLRSECSAVDVSPWTAIQFNTTCGAITSYPYTQDFESTTFPPLCWTNTTLTQGSGWSGNVDGNWIRDSYSYTQYGNGSGWAALDGAEGASALLVTPQFNFQAGREYHVSFTLYRQMNSSWLDVTDQMNVYVGSAPSKLGATQLAAYVVGDDNITTGIYTYDLDIPASMTGNCYIMFEGLYNYYGYVYLDDVRVDIYPTCRDLNAPTVVGTTATTATVSESMGINHTAVQYGIAPYSATATVASITSMILSDSTGVATFTGLTANTNYSVFARGICSGNDTSAWSSAVKVTTKVDDCFEPDGLHIIGLVNDTSATIGWNAVPDATSYTCVFTAGQTADTVVVTTNQVTKTDLQSYTSYVFTVQSSCASGTTSWSTLRFKTTSHPAYIPYTTGFEATDDNTDWVKTNSSESNNFTVGADVNGRHTGTQGLYISDNNSSYSQSLPTAGGGTWEDVYDVAFISRTIYFPAAGNYDVSFDWKCDPVLATSSYYSYYEAYGRAFMAPAGTTFTADDDTYKRSVPNGGIALGSNLTGSQTWERSATVISVDEPCFMDLVFMWYSLNGYDEATASEVSDYPLAIDNVSVTEVACLPVSSFSTFGISDTVASVVVNKAFAVDMDYALLRVNSEDSISTFTSVTSTQMTDTVTLSGLTPTATYYFFAREKCDSAHISAWRSTSFTTTAVPAALPYSHGFETVAENANWMYAQNNDNQFMIGNSTASEGTNSLYISDDGANYNYDDGASSYAYAYRVFYLPAGLYEYSYDWKCYGESSYDFGRVFLLPASTPITAGSYLSGLGTTSTPTGAVALDGGSKLNLSSDYVSVSDTFSIASANSYNFVVFWRNDGSGGSQPPFSIDNITLRLSTCPFPLGAVDSITQTTARVIITNQSENSQLVYAVSSSGQIEDAILVDTLPYAAVDTLHLTGLSASTNYKLMLRSLCSATDESMWNRVSFKTECGAITSFPYTEGFEALPTSYSAGMISDICWDALNESSSYPYYHATDYCGYSGSSEPAEGEYCLKMYSSNSTPLYLVLPQMDSINNLQVSFQVKHESTTSSGIIYAGYMTDINNAGSFVSATSTARTQTWTAYTATFPNAPVGARIAFKYGDGPSNNYYGYIDDVRVSMLATGDTYTDTICYNKPYTLHGFNVPATQMSVGDNTLTYIKTATVQGECDTLFTAHVYMRADISSTSYDTICAGQPYTVGRWNIQNPKTRRYFTTFSNASACGCDSTVELFLTVVPTSHNVNDTICMGGSYQFGDTTITTAGTYRRITLNSLGCADTTNLNLFVADTAVTVTASVCQGQGYQFEGQMYYQSGTYRVMATGAHGCPLAKTLVLTVFSTDSTMTVSFCQGGSVQVVDTVISTAGYHEIVRVNSTGCDVTYHITATSVTPTPAEVYDYACEGHNYSGHGISGLTVTQDTMVTVTTKTLDGKCDSIAHINLTYVRTAHSDTTAYIKEGESFTWHNNTYKTAGDYDDNMQSVVTGCDSIVTLHLVVSGTGVDNVTDVVVEVVPNPVDPGATAYVYGNFASEVETVEILNSFGQVIDRFAPVGYPIEVQGITASGLYYVRLTTRDGSVHLQKLIVK